jgi:uncharacterized membrane protein YfhO
MQSLGFAAKNTYNRYLWEENSPIANLFLNLKYVIERDSSLNKAPYFREIHHYGDVYLFENDAYLPLGFLANNKLADVSLPITGSAFANQNVILSAASGVGGNYWTAFPLNTLKITSDVAKLTSVSKEGSCYYNTEKAGTVDFTYTVHESGFMSTYIDLPGRNSFTIYVNGNVLYTESVALPQMFSICQVEPGDVVEIRFKVNANERNTLKCKAQLLDEELFREAYDVLAASTLELTEFSTTYVEGIIQANRNGLLYTSIPQDGNWVAYVDGEKAEIVLVGEAMVALDLTEGSHDVEFRYENKAFNLGWKISLGCLLTLLAITGIAYYPELKKRFSKTSK